MSSPVCIPVSHPRLARFPASLKLACFPGASQQSRSGTFVRSRVAEPAQAAGTANPVTIGSDPQKPFRAGKSSHAPWHKQALNVWERGGAQQRHRSTSDCSIRYQQLQCSVRFYVAQATRSPRFVSSPFVLYLAALPAVDTPWTPCRLRLRNCAKIRFVFPPLPRRSAVQ